MLADDQRLERKFANAPRELDDAELQAAFDALTRQVHPADIVHVDKAAELQRITPPAAVCHDVAAVQHARGGHVLTGLGIADGEGATWGERAMRPKAGIYRMDKVNTCVVDTCQQP